jgi:hypothetical protein
MRKIIAPLLVVPVVVGVLALRETRREPPPAQVAPPLLAAPVQAPRVHRELPPPPRSPEEERALEAIQLHPELAGKVDAIYARTAERAPSQAERAFWTQELIDERPESLVDEYVGLLAKTFAQVYRRPPEFAELQHFTDFLDKGSPLL